MVFTKGHLPYKGTEKTQFKKGRIPWNKGAGKIIDLKEYMREYSEKYIKIKEHRIEHNQRNKKWINNHPEYKKIKRKRDRFNRRELGYIPLNESFEGSHGHHIDKIHVIYIPKELHKSIIHNVKTGTGMKEINKLAFEYIKEGES